MLVILILFFLLIAPFYLKPLIIVFIISIIIGNKPKPHLANVDKGVFPKASPRDHTTTNTTPTISIVIPNAKFVVANCPFLLFAILYYSFLSFYFFLIFPIFLFNNNFIFFYIYL